MSEREKVLDAIGRLGRTVTVADIAAQTGLPVHVANLQLNKIALESKGILQVAQSGNIIYKFAVDYRLPSLSGLPALFGRVVKVLTSIAMYLIQVSFGILLICSFLTLLVLFAIVLAIIMFGGEGGDGDGGDGDGMDLGFDFFDTGNLFMFFVRARHDITVPETYLGKRIDIGDKGFLYNCFSFLFGDGDPNAALPEQRWRHVANLIRHNDGVVVSEQLAPYTDADPKDESQVLPALVRFEGFPEVTESGNIVYLFPSLQVTVVREKLFDLPPQTTEEPWQFTNSPMARMHMVYFFAGANLAGWYCVHNNLWRLEFLQPYSPIIYGMLLYAVFFLAFPILRQLVNVCRNAAIEIRNNKRKQYVEDLKSQKVQGKLAEARAFAQQILRLRAGHVVYSTDRDILEQQFEP